MRYAVITAAVLSGAIFMAHSSQSQPNEAHLFTAGNIKPMFQTAVLADTPFTHVKVASITPVAVAAAADTSTEAVPAAADVEVAPEPAHTITVGAGDNLAKLAAAAGTTYERLYDANPSVANPNIIHPGQELRVPTADEVLASRPLPVAAPVVTAAVVQSSAQLASAPVSVAAVVASGSVWDDLARCESGGNWAINTGNGYYGGLQFSLATWQGLGGVGLPSQASREEQIAKATILQARSGWGQWPACTAKLGLR